MPIPPPPPEEEEAEEEGEEEAEEGRERRRKVSAHDVLGGGRVEVAGVQRRLKRLFLLLHEPMTVSLSSARMALPWAPLGLEPLRQTPTLYP